MKDALEKINPRFYILLSGLLIGLSIIFSGIGWLSYVALVPLAYAIYKRVNTGDYNAK